MIDIRRDQGRDTHSGTYLSQYDADFLFQNSLVLIDHGDYEMALNLIEAVIQEHSSHAEAIRWKGYCLKQMGKLERACQEYLKVAHLNPGETSFFEVAESFYEFGHDDIAKDYYNRALDIIDYDSPHLFQIYKKLGNISVKTLDFDSAEEFYNKAYIQNNHSDELFVNYGTLEIQKENYDVAIDRFKQALDLNKNNEKAWVGLALIYRAKSDFDLSWAELKHALDLNPYSATAIKLCVDWSLQEMEYDYAIEVLEKFLDKDSSSVDWLFTYAGLLYKSGDWKKTQTTCKFILEKNPSYSAAMELFKISAKKVSS